MPAVYAGGKAKSAKDCANSVAPDMRLTRATKPRAASPGGDITPVVCQRYAGGKAESAKDCANAVAPDMPSDPGN